MSELGPEKVSDNAERSAEQDANMASLLPVDVTAIPSVQIGIGLLPESSAEQEQEKGAPQCPRTLAAPTRRARQPTMQRGSLGMRHPPRHLSGAGAARRGYSGCMLRP